MKNILFILVASILLFSCAKENSNEFVPYPNNILADTVWTLEASANAEVHSIADHLSFPAKADSIDALTGGTLSFHDGLSVKIPASACRFLNGTIATGKIKVEVIQLKTKGDFVRFRKPTTSHHRLLESGGSFFIKVTKEGEELTLVPGKYITLKYKNANPVKEMKVFYGEHTGSVTAGTNTGFTWMPAQDSSVVRTFENRDLNGNTTLGYEMLSGRFRWVNCDYFIDTTQPRTRINVVLPPHFTNKNTTVFAVFKDRNIVVQLSPDFTSRSFFAINMPVNKNIIVMSLSKNKDDFYLSGIETPVTIGLTLHLKPELKNKQQLLQYLEKL